MWLAETIEDRSAAIAATGAAALALCAFVMLRWPILALAIAALAMVLALLKAAAYTRAHPRSLLFALILIETLMSTTAIDESVRPLLRYSLIFLFAAPAFAQSVRSGILLRGGYGLYSLYFAVAALSVTYSVAPAYSATRVFASVLLFGAICTVAADSENDEDVSELFRFAWMACGMVVAILALSMVALPESRTWPPSQFGDNMARFAGVFGSPNQVGEIMLATVASAALYWPSAPTKARGLIALTVIAAMLFGALADSRSAFVALGVGFSAAAIYRWRWTGALVICGALVVATIAAALLDGGAREYLVRGETATLTGRTEIWGYVVDQIRRSPIFGYGFETEGQLFQSRYFPLWGEIWEQGPHSSIHSGYLARAAGVGIPAALLWMYLIARALLRVLRGDRSVPDLVYPVLIAALPVLLFNLVESTGGDCRESVGLLLTLIWCLAERARIRHARDPECEFGESA